MSEIEITKSFKMELITEREVKFQIEYDENKEIFVRENNELIMVSIHKADFLEYAELVNAVAKEIRGRGRASRRSALR